MESWNAAGPIVQWIGAVVAVGIAIFGAMLKVFSNDKIWAARKAEWEATMAELKEAHAIQIKEYKDAYRVACTDMAAKMAQINEDHRAEVREIKEGHKEADADLAKRMADLYAANELVAESHMARAIGEAKAVTDLENERRENKRLRKRIAELEDFDVQDTGDRG